MRILHVLNHTHRFNGNVHAAIDLACAQADLGHDIAVCSVGGDFDQVLTNHGVTILALDQRRTVPALIRATIGLFGYVRRWRADVVHAHMVTSALIAYPACKMLRKPLVTTVHNAFERSAVLMKVGTRVIAVSAAMSTNLQRRGIPARVLRTVLNGTIGSARFAGPPPPITLAHPNVVFVGGLHPRKGVADLLNAFDEVIRDVPQAHLYLVGEGPSEGVYKALVDSLPCRSAVTFCGAVRDPRSHLRACDVLVLPSLADPAPLVLSEAREAGCAVVGTAVDGIPELLENGEAGLLVAAGSPPELAREIRRLLLDRSILQEYRARSQIGIERLSVARVARDTLTVYEECLDMRTVAMKTVAAQPPSALPRPSLAGSGARMVGSATTIAVVYATAGRGPVLAATIEALASQRRPPDMLVVSSTTPEDVGALSSRPDVQVLIGPRGLTRQRNAALRYLDGKADIVVFFDDDFIPHPGWLEAVEGTFQARPDVACVTGTVIADGIKGAGLTTEGALAALSSWITPDNDRALDPYSPYGCNMAFRCAAIRDLYFDERLVLYGWQEDRDFGGALAKRGGRLVKIGTAAGVHLGTKRARESGRRIGYSQVINPVYLYRKGTMTFASMLYHVCTNIAANVTRAPAPEPYVDRIGRLRGNGLGLFDLVRGRVIPERTESL